MRSWKARARRPTELMVIPREVYDKYPDLFHLPGHADRKSCIAAADVCLSSFSFLGARISSC